MRIVFFGASHGVPEAGRRCSCAYIDINGNRYFVDMGMNAAEELANRNIPIESIKAVFVTHVHGDHTNGLLPFIDICSWKYRTANPLFYMPYDAEKFKESVSAWFSYNGTKLRDFEFNTFLEGEIYNDGILKVTAFKTMHTKNTPSYAFLLEAEGKRVLFGGDLSTNGPHEDFPVSVLEKPLDLAVLEAAHFAATSYLPIFEGKTQNIKNICFNHCNNRFIPSAYEVKNTLTDVNTVIALDGTEFEI